MAIEGTQDLQESEIGNRRFEAAPQEDLASPRQVILSSADWRVGICWHGAFNQNQQGCRSYECPPGGGAAWAGQFRCRWRLWFQEPMPIFLTALGTVMPYMSVTVKARVSGQLQPVRFTEGQEVRQGQTIMEIDPKPYQAALDQAKGTLAHDEALLKNAQAEYARYKALYAAGVVSKGDDGRRRGPAGAVRGRHRIGQSGN